MKYIILFTLLALLGVYLLQEGITGLAIGQSCCFPSSENCPPENACNVAKTERPAIFNYVLILLGAKLIILFPFLIYKRIKKRQVIPLSQIFKQS